MGNERTLEARKVFVIGLDGATFELIRPWAAEGKLPTLGQLLRDGASGPLRSTYPPLTGPAWSSFITGKSPEGHGVLEFFRREPSSYRQRLNSYLDIDGRSLWNLLSEGDRQVGIVGLPLTYPPEPVNGFLISGLLTPPGSRDFTYPRSLLPELERELGTYRLRHDEKYRRADPEPFLREQYDILENNVQAAMYLMTHKPWDFFMVHLLGTDRIQHEFWHLLDAEHPQHDPAERARLGNVVLEFYQAVDAALARMLAALDPDTVVLVMSDHGFGPVYRFLNVNTWLLGEGLLYLQRGLGTGMRSLLFRLGFNYASLGQWILKAGLGRRAKRLGRGRREALQRRMFLSLDDIDWSRSKVYSMGNFGQLYVNLRGREPEGIVSPGEEYEALLDDLTGRLEALVDPQTGRPVVERVMRREEIYDGPYADRAPDLLFLTRNMEYKAMGLSDFASPRVFDAVYGTTGHHRMDGILIGRGPGVLRPGAQVEGARIQDLAPTILYMMGQPVPRDMDGRVLEEMFTDAFRRQHAMVYSGEGETPTDTDGAVYSDREEAAVMDVLRSLGYVT